MTLPRCTLGETVGIFKNCWVLQEFRIILWPLGFVRSREVIFLFLGKLLWMLGRVLVLRWSLQCISGIFKAWSNILLCFHNMKRLYHKCRSLYYTLLLPSNTSTSCKRYFLLLLFYQLFTCLLLNLVFRCPLYFWFFCYWFEF